MTNKETVHALRYCSDPDYIDCTACKYFCYGDCLKRLVADAADLVERLTAENAKAEAERDALLGKWISVDGTLPAPGMRVLATDGVFVGEAYRTSANTWRRYDGMAMRDCIGSVVTYWMPLPPVPKDGESNA